MFKNIITTTIILFISSIALASPIRNIGEPHQTVYCVVDENGNHVTGQTVALKIKKVSNGYWYDFNDSTFKNTGWTSKSVNLSEDSTEGYYYYTWTPPSGETTPEQYLFIIDNANAVYGDHQGEEVNYQDMAKPSDVEIYVGQ